MNQKAFTGRSRKRTTGLSVRIADVVSRLLITVGGIGTIIAVSTVALFLVLVIWPLFTSPSVEQVGQYPAAISDNNIMHLDIDEFQTIGAILENDSTLHSFRIDTGEALDQTRLFEEETLTTSSFAIADDSIALGFADGTVRLGRMQFETRFYDRTDVPEALHVLAEGEVAKFKGGIVQVTPEGQYRQQKIDVEIEDPIKTGSTSEVVLLDHVLIREGPRKGPIFCALSADDTLSLYSLRERKNLLTGKITYSVSRADVPYEKRPETKIHSIALSALGDNVLVAYEDGTLVRYNTRDYSNPRKVAEHLDAVDDPGEHLTAMRYILGRGTIVTGDSTGTIRAWFRYRPDVSASDQVDIMVMAHEMPGNGAAVTCLSPSAQSRMLAAGYADGSYRVFFVTTEHKLIEQSLGTTEPILAIRMAPKDDGIIAATSDNIYHWRFDPKYPEASLKSMFTRVWYESAPTPAHVWQSSAAEDDFEMKLGMIPLIFGTIKATIFAMVFAVPIALLAAIYTSEFLHPKVKAKIKPTIEMMASLPSVVLGFLGGLVIAQFVETSVSVVLACFFVLPLTFLLCAYLWQLLPLRVTLILDQLGEREKPDAGMVRYLISRLIFAIGGPRFILMILAIIPACMLSAYVAGPLMEKYLFAGNITLWLDGQIGTGTGGWFIFLLPLSAIFTAYCVSRYVNPYYRRLTDGWTREGCAVMNLVKFILGCIGCVVITASAAWLLNGLGLDPRGDFHVWGMNLSPMQTYVQRNALIVGFVMGFAVIPIIYTIADDALSAVPEHLRSASLGSGATPWQTAIRVIIPTAMSGLFSACMIGLGRAVGETMIVLMAAGNTPVLDLNIFNGFRTLSANIAVELPEAVRDSTHYRTLFLAAFVLFIMTFILNTIAEIVRLRFRKRSIEL